ncbi:hypothetical protein MASR1M48_17180 [Lactococcus petauri]
MNCTISDLARKNGTLCRSMDCKPCNEARHPKKADSSYRAKDDNDLKNKLYALICSKLEPHEARGFNAHSRTQSIMDITVKEMDEWLDIQREHNGQKEENPS